MLLDVVLVKRNWRSNTKAHIKNATKWEKHENNNFQRKLNIRGVKNTNVANNEAVGFSPHRREGREKKAWNSWEQKIENTNISRIWNVESDLIGLLTDR